MSAPQAQEEACEVSNLQEALTHLSATGDNQEHEHEHEQLDVKPNATDLSNTVGRSKITPEYKGKAPGQSAAQAVLTIHELVENILIFANARAIERATKVSKAFYSVVKTSTIIQGKAALKRVSDEEHCEGAKAITCPYYDFEEGIALHPSLSVDLIAIEAIVRFLPSPASLLRSLGDKKRDFVTSPPAESIGLSISFRRGTSPETPKAKSIGCLVNAPGGVKIEDLLGTIGDLLASRPDAKPDSITANMRNEKGFLPPEHPFVHPQLLRSSGPSRH